MTRHLLLAVLLLVGCGSRMLKLDPKKVKSVSLAISDGTGTFCMNGPLWPEWKGLPW